MGALVFISWIKHHKTMWLQPKNIDFGVMVHKIHTNFGYFWAKMGHSFNKISTWRCLGTLDGLRTSKQCDMHSQTSFLGGWFMFYCQFGYGPRQGPGHANLCVPTLTWNISYSKIFLNKLVIQTERVHPGESRKIMI